MTIGAGETLLHYRVGEKIGAGGMGEVYSAEDTRLGRPVALKLLPAELRHDPLRLARLEREARLPASLNHPSVATLHGLEESADVNDDTVYAATFSPQTGRIGAPEVLFALGEPRVILDLDITPGGERFLAAVGDRSRSGSIITVLLNWTHILATGR